MIASQGRHIHIVSMLMDSGALVNLQNKVPTKILQVCMRACTFVQAQWELVGLSLRLCLYICMYVRVYD